MSSLRENMSSLRDRVDRVVTRLVFNCVNTMEEFNWECEQITTQGVS